MSTDDPSIGHAVVLFDGVCNFCNRFVNSAIQRDRKGYFLFAPLQSPQGEELQRRFGFDPTALDTFILIEKRRVYTRSTAALRIAGRLGWPYRLLYPLLAVPRPLRDLFYDWFARRRYRWFGRRESCMTPTEEVRSRFLIE
jgi:predicted DCC family thiol-disulfide oxidoreductase YuxK